MPTAATHARTKTLPSAYCSALRSRPSSLRSIRSSTPVRCPRRPSKRSRIWATVGTTAGPTPSMNVLGVALEQAHEGGDALQHDPLLGRLQQLDERTPLQHAALSARSSARVVEVGGRQQRVDLAAHVVVQPRHGGELRAVGDLVQRDPEPEVGRVDAERRSVSTMLGATAAAAAGEVGGEPVQRRLGRAGGTERHPVGGDVEGEQPVVRGAHQPGQRADAVERARLGTHRSGSRQPAALAVAVPQRPGEAGHRQAGQHRGEPLGRRGAVVGGHGGQQPGERRGLQQVLARQPAAVDQRDRARLQTHRRQVRRHHAAHGLGRTGERRRQPLRERDLPHQRLGQVVVAAGQHPLDQPGHRRALHRAQLGRGRRGGAALHGHGGTGLEQRGQRLPGGQGRVGVPGDPVGPHPPAVDHERADRRHGALGDVRRLPAGTERLTAVERVVDEDAGDGGGAERGADRRGQVAQARRLRVARLGLGSGQRRVAPAHQHDLPRRRPGHHPGGQPGGGLQGGERRDRTDDLGGRGRQERSGGVELQQRRAGLRVEDGHREAAPDRRVGQRRLDGAAQPVGGRHGSGCGQLCEQRLADGWRRRRGGDGDGPLRRVVLQHRRGRPPGGQRCREQDGEQGPRARRCHDHRPASETSPGPRPRPRGRD